MFFEVKPESNRKLSGFLFSIISIFACRKMSKVFSFRFPRTFIGVILGGTVFSTLAMMGHVLGGILMGLGCILLGFFNVRVSSRKNTVFTFIWFFLALLFTAQISQMIVDCHIGTVFMSNWKNFASEMLLPMTLPLLLFVITLRPKLSFFLGAHPFIILSIGNYYLYAFRGSDLNPMDFFAIGTATQVAGNYSFDLGVNQIYGMFAFVMTLFLGFSFEPVVFKKKCVSRIVFSFLTVLSIYFSVGRLSSVYIYCWEKMGSMSNGYLLNFSAQLLNVLNQKPEGYSYDFIQQIENRYRKSDSEKQKTSGEKYPTIIAIMDEAYADVSILNPKLDQHQFYKDLNENSIKGYALASVFGGGTANSEYEFLSGNSMAFVDHGVSVFQQYIARPTYSMAHYLKELGYETFATHPFNKQGWSRSTVWPYLGFDHVTFKEDYSGKKKIRDYISDQEMFEYVVNKFEHKGDKPMFLFGVTMQNHSAYHAYPSNKKFSVTLEDFPGYPDVELYMGLVRESDKALKYLISYFEKVEEPVVIVFYGDHFPGVNKEFFKKVYGKDFEALQDKQKLHTIPFFVWANYPVEKEEVDLSSFNYLSNYVYKAAGIEPPPFNKFLADVQKEIPIMNSWGYYSKTNQKFVEYGKAEGKEAEVLKEYRMMQYNSLFDKDNRSDYFFGVR